MNEFGDDNSLEPMKELSKNKYDIYSRCKLLFIGLPFLKKKEAETDAGKEYKELELVQKAVSIHIFAIERNVYNKLSHRLKLGQIYNDNSTLIEDMINSLDKHLDSDDFGSYKQLKLETTGPILDTPAIKEELAKLEDTEETVTEFNDEAVTDFTGESMVEDE